MGYSLTIEVPTRATDANKTNRGNKFAHNSTRQKIKKLIGLLVRGQEPVKPLTSFSLSITRHGPKTLDWDNVVSSLKAHIDGLKDAKIIKGDGWKYIRNAHIDQVTGKKAGRKLVITVAEV